MVHPAIFTTALQGGTIISLILQKGRLRHEAEGSRPHPNVAEAGCKSRKLDSPGLHLDGLQVEEKWKMGSL